MENNEIKQAVLLKAKAAKEASRKLLSMSAEQKNNMLSAMADALQQNMEDILFHNEIDVQAAKEAYITSTLIDKLTLNEKRINDMIESVRNVILLQDPIGTVIEQNTSSIDIDVKKIRVPLGVIAMIYEARPNVTVDAAILCLKAGNAVILKGGSEAINSNRILTKIICEAGAKAGMPVGSIQFIDTPDRSAIQELLHLDNLIDLLIPRGGEELVKFIREHSLIPVLSHGRGLCHTYIDKDADVDMAINVAFNAKCQRPSVCNAMETLLVHRDIADKVLPELCRLYNEAGVEIEGCSISQGIVNSIKPATEKDWKTEYLDLKISIKVVTSLEEAIEHITKYGSMHSEAVITKNKEVADRFIAEVDAAAVFVNASTRLHDGSVFGLGCEIGISTQKLHARGAMGIKELTTTKYVVRGNGAIRN
ncbi:MAG: glutamate-5-semialdehyde dehydrogenase [Endomicrobium sp.]|uniref:glutamate-5-semialdehyde dehydrogenase n=1 Tax=Candidatus Endomicrobiellum pyrsonymphae TaxID=1408203 RepID=UPI0035867277|nr:glutamate-5-semialdehyde dehydrogenase [Endomicrobium sp.]